MKIFYAISPQYGYLTATLIEGLRALGHDVAFTEDSNYGVRIPDREFSAYAEHADLIIVGSNTGVRMGSAKTTRNPRKVFVDGSDFQGPWIPDDVPSPCSPGNRFGHDE